MGGLIWKVYMSGEIHGDWRQRISGGVAAAGLPVELFSPVTVHGDSDDCGAAIFGPEENSFWHDHKGASLNSMRASTLIAAADIIVVRFGEKYKQWNAAFDAGYAAALGKPMITLHTSELDHALKEVDAVASAVAREPRQVVQALAYVIRGDMPAGGSDALAGE